jgi:hypothetical protein
MMVVLGWKGSWESNNGNERGNSCIRLEAGRTHMIGYCGCVLICCTSPRFMQTRSYDRYDACPLVYLPHLNRFLYLRKFINIHSLIKRHMAKGLPVLR